MRPPMIGRKSNRCSTTRWPRSTKPTAAAILLRYFENKNLREVGEAFGTIPMTPRKNA